MRNSISISKRKITSGFHNISPDHSSEIRLPIERDQPIALTTIADNPATRQQLPAHHETPGPAPPGARLTGPQ